MLATACADGGAEEPALETASALAACPEDDGSSLIACGVVQDRAQLPIAGAIVELGSVVTKTAADGSFAIVSSKLGPQVLRIRAPRTMPLITILTRSVVQGSFTLQPLFQQVFPRDRVISLADPLSGAAVQVEPSALVRPNGAGPIGPIEVGLRYINPSRESMPGADDAIGAGGVPGYLESYGAMYVSAVDTDGVELRLRQGAAARIRMPLPQDRATTAPPNAPLWTFDQQKGTWLQQQAPSAAQQVTGKPSCQEPRTLSCNPDDCSAISGQSWSGASTSLGFINVDIEKTTPACTQIVVDASALPPGTTLPICLEFTLPISGGGSQTRQQCFGDGTTVMYNLPANASVTARRVSGQGCPPPSPPSPGTTFNTGAPWGGTGTPPNAGVCNSVLSIPPLF